MNQISPLAYVHPEAKLGDNNIIGPFCYIDRNTVMGDNNVLQNSVTINFRVPAYPPSHKTSNSKVRIPSARWAASTPSART